MTGAWRRFKYKWLIRRDSAKELNSRVDVENRLWDAYHGKKPPPTPEECRDMANKLGVPDWAKKRNAHRNKGVRVKSLSRRLWPFGQSD